MARKKRESKLKKEDLDPSGKPGKVVRVSPTVWKQICAQRKKGETIDAVLRRAMGLPTKKGDETPLLFVLPSDLCESEEEARGRAVVRSVREKKKDLAKETPLRVRTV